ncbi:MAG: thioredoxin family protein [Desulfobacterales bacterium]
MQVKQIETPQEFDKTIESGVCLVDFKAPWCGPCKTQTPIIQELAGDFDGRALLAELDVSASRDVAARYGVNSIPTLIVFRDGKEFKRFVGVQSGQVLAGAINEALAGR